MQKTMKVPPFHGLLVVDKPGGMTSREVVDRVQCWFPRGTKVGHTGTLDPLATGVMVVCVGAATRLTEYVQNMKKIYRAGILLGSRSDTDDADGHIIASPNAAPPDRAAVDGCLRGFLGEIDQTPPAFSAAKVTGRRAYALARRGEDVTLKPRRVQIYDIVVQTYKYPRLEIEVRCGRGTYIRSLARDLGERLGCGALIETLRRTQVGPFGADIARSLDIDADEARGELRPLAAALWELPRVHVDDAAAAKIRQGCATPVDESQSLTAGELAVIGLRGALVAVARFDPQENVIRPQKVFGPLWS
jgi:tRNA pseudouridine55 synthase